MKVYIKEDDFNQIVEFARARVPEEACGLIAGTQTKEEKRIEKVYFLTNIGHTSERFSLDPAEHLSAVKDMQKVMDEYAGGISTHYAYTEQRLRLADAEIDRLTALTERLAAPNMHELLFVYELRDRLTVCKTLIFHLLNRKETRWHIFGENQDYPDKNPECFAYLNSRIKDGKREALWRKIVKENEFRHTDAVPADGGC